MNKGHTSSPKGSKQIKDINLIKRGIKERSRLDQEKGYILQPVNTLLHVNTPVLQCMVKVRVKVGIWVLVRVIFIQQLKGLI